MDRAESFKGCFLPIRINMKINATLIFGLSIALTIFAISLSALWRVRGGGNIVFVPLIGVLSSIYMGYKAFGIAKNHHVEK